MYDGELGRFGHWLRLPMPEVDIRCAEPGCDLLASEGRVYPRRVDAASGGFAALVACQDHQEQLRSTLASSEALLPGSGPTVPSIAVVRQNESWYRTITASEVVVACGPMRCSRCERPADFLTWAVDRGVPDKWYPEPVCREHAEERAVYNFGSLESPGDYFAIDLEWNGTDWGKPLPWPLTEPSPADVVAQVVPAVPRRTREFLASPDSPAGPVSDTSPRPSPDAT